MSLESDIKSMVESIGFELYDTAVVTEGDETIYRVSITSKDGVSLDKCVEVTHLISPLLDVESPVRGEYRLEVSSPGIERALKTLKHFKSSIGEKAKISLVGVKYRGEILRVEDNTIYLDDELEGEIAIDFNDIKSARTYFTW